jgi:hypothetical protein
MWYLIMIGLVVVLLRWNKRRLPRPRERWERFFQGRHGRSGEP